MSHFIELIATDLTQVSGLCESKTVWGGQEVSYDPLRYDFNGMSLLLTPIADHVRKHLPLALSGASHCLEVPESMLLDWRAGTLSIDQRATLAQLFTAVATQPDWLVVYDASANGEHRIIKCTRAELFELVDQCVSRAADRGLTTFQPRSA